ncbi:MAG: D-2-hydroxyacid dehydrogenase [Saprospiraceae bacterium]|nr:D-2-hydroxyacid dehydrogenase [Saprospiraceae bacterium]
MEIVFLDAFTNNPGDISFEALEALGHFKAYHRTSLDELPARVQNAEIVIVNKFVINDEALKYMPNVKYIVVAATGFNNIDINAVKNQNIPVSNVVGYSTNSVTQHVFAAIFTILNKLSYYDSEVKKGRWSQSPDFCFYDHSITEVAGSCLGVYGYGAIGSRVCEVANILGMQVIATNRNTSKPQKDYITFVSDNELFAQSDILSLHAPLNDETAGIVNKDTLKMMKQNAIIINTSRGGLIKENDLFYALDHNLIAGAALDVMISEPPHYSNPLVNHQKCLVTPHIAWASTHARTKLLEGIASNIVCFQQGKIQNPIY